LCLPLLLACLVIARPAWSIEWEIARDVRVSITGDTSVISAAGFEFTFPTGWKLDVHPAGFVYASIAKDAAPTVAITSCSIVLPDGDCSATGKAAADSRTRFLTSVQKDTGVPVKSERNDGIEEYTRLGKRQVTKLFVSPRDTVTVVYFLPADSESDIESEMASLLNGKLFFQ
jgi:hypothetical protein